jgi:hypothetical protein
MSWSNNLFFTIKGAVSEMSTSFLISAKLSALIAGSCGFVVEVVATKVTVVGQLDVADRAVPPDDVASSQQAVETTDRIVGGKF